MWPRSVTSSLHEKITREEREGEREGEREETGTEIMQILCKSRNGVTLIRVTISKVIGRIDVVSSSPFLPTPLPPPTGKQPEVLVSRYDFTISFFILLSGETDRRNVRSGRRLPSPPNTCRIRAYGLPERWPARSVFAATLSILVQGSRARREGEGSGGGFIHAAAAEGGREEFISVGRARYLRATYVRVPNSRGRRRLSKVVTNSRRRDRAEERRGERRSAGSEVVRGG